MAELLPELTELDLNPLTDTGCLALDARIRIEPATPPTRSCARGLYAADVMSAPVLTIGPGQPVALAARRMAERRAPVVRGRRRRHAGGVSRRDVLGTFLRPDKHIQDNIDTSLRAGLGHIAGRVTVRVADGVATVDGHLELHSEAMVVVGLVRTVRGVVGVVDNLTYRAETMAELDASTGFQR